MPGEHPVNSGSYDDAPFLAELYDLVPAYAERHDLAFYLELCRSADGAVLELGCGTGRVVLAAAAEGVQVVGLDASPHMLAKCSEKLSGLPQDVQERVTLVQASMTDFGLDRSFALVTSPFRPLR